MAEESPSKGKFVPYLLDLLALAFVFGFVDGLRTGQAWYAYGGCLAAAIVLLLIAFRWSLIETWISASNKQGLPLLAMTALALVTVAAVGYDIYDRNHKDDDIPEFDEPSAAFYQSYSHTSTTCNAIVHGDRLWQYKDHYRIALACILVKATTGMIDAPGLQVGNEFDITHGEIQMEVDVSETMRPLPPFGENYLLLLIPPNVSIAQFSTLRQARLLGVKIKMIGSQSPAL